MKRLHIHIGVEQLEEAIQFYSHLLGVGPVKRKADYAKWMVDDPRVNLAISTRVATKGVDHLGIQVDDDQELTDIRQRLTSEKLSLADEGETTCCYAKSDKSWVLDPAGIAWEAYRTMEDAEIFSAPSGPEATACCTPVLQAEPDPECKIPEQKLDNCCQ
ncbi:MAG: ArsI/CadI family heavy metal resistance metalloenzyme [Nitrospirales bacterium]